ncbi:hypothetical protein ACM44_13385 [Chryseobacterium koreense CCUG 49689]|uniref:Uncharacterized protein n=1 Tax=Chryseobacterium koreense CCUG 49689 TaxID=1304281 RepID=A0A0J7IWP3_9FLAO|nr:hypothetical protein ACM44_13385 [Chryseobacterium koreense CCUG 49689]MBB5334741.1 hypothetical protein [Chryseobacterium koreense]
MIGIIAILLLGLVLGIFGHVINAYQYWLRTNFAVFMAILIISVFIIAVALDSFLKLMLFASFNFFVTSHVKYLIQKSS